MLVTSERERERKREERETGTERKREERAHFLCIIFFFPLGELMEQRMTATKLVSFSSLSIASIP